MVLHIIECTTGSDSFLPAFLFGKVLYPCPHQKLLRTGESSAEKLALLRPASNSPADTNPSLADWWWLPAWTIFWFLLSVSKQKRYLGIRTLPLSFSYQIKLAKLCFCFPAHLEICCHLRNWGRQVALALIQP